MTFVDGDIDRIRASLGEALAHSEDLGQDFYDELFRRAPAVRPMFAEDLALQRRKLVATLGSVVRHLDELDVLSDEIRRLGRLHADLGATPEQYEVVGETLIDVLERCVPGFSPDDRAAWERAYGALSAAFQAG